jgi:hypothetical protein
MAQRHAIASIECQIDFSICSPEAGTVAARSPRETSARPDGSSPMKLTPISGALVQKSVVAFQQSRRLGDVDGDAPRLVRRQHLRLQRFGFAVARIPGLGCRAFFYSKSGPGGVALPKKGHEFVLRSMALT